MGRILQFDDSARLYFIGTSTTTPGSSGEAVMTDDLSQREFGYEVTELLETAPSLTGGQLVQGRQTLLESLRSADGLRPES